MEWSFCVDASTKSPAPTCSIEARRRSINDKTTSNNLFSNLIQPFLKYRLSNTPLFSPVPLRVSFTSRGRPSPLSPALSLFYSSQSSSSPGLERPGHLLAVSTVFW
jgi:hypothetical protein